MTTTETEILDVVAVISNPARFKRRYQLFNEFVERMGQEPRVRLTTVELQQRNRPFITNATIQLRTSHELWHKENLINIGIQNLPEDSKYVAWIDADIEFQNKEWVSETIEQLQTYSVVQLFSHAIDLGPKGETLQVHTGFGYLYANGQPMSNYRANTPYKNGHTGYAYAMRRECIDAIGGLLDFAILGSGDAHMALAMIGKVDLSINKRLHENYKQLCRIFQERCEKHLQRNIGYVDGTILHSFHADKKYRAYKERWNILYDNNFDPLRDIKKDGNQLWQLEGNKPRLRDEIRVYFRQRNEDSCEVNQEYTYYRPRKF
jgi:glycosyltransferase involved in cell wall biosynthesis